MKESLVVLSFLRQLLLAHSSAEVSQIQAQFQELRRNQHVCEVQTVHHLVPDSCFRALKREKSWGLVTSEQSQELEQKWDRQCELAAKQNLYSHDEWLQVRVEDLSSVCKNVIQHSLEIHRYRWSEN
jgi:hypothetical protein